MPFTHEESDVTQAREAAIKAERDTAAHAEAQRREAAAAENERTAPLSENFGALPLTLQTLKYLPVDAQQQYVRMPDGSFRLAWVRTDDEASTAAYLDQLGKSIKRFNPGESPVSAAAAERRAAEMLAKVNGILDRDAKAKRDAEVAQLEEKNRLAREELERQRAAYRASFVPAAGPVE